MGGRYGNLPRNAVLAVSEVVLNGIILLVLYRYLLDRLGAEQVGLWSIVLAMATVSRISEFGFAGGATKFVASARALEDEKRVAGVIQTALLSVAFLLGVVLLLFYPLVKWTVLYVTPEHAHGQAVTLIPYALAAVWMGGIAAVCRSSLDGVHRADLRSLLSMSSSALYMGLVFLLVPGYGLVGVGLAQLAQAIALALAAWVVLRMQAPGLPWAPVAWRWQLFLEMFRYSFKFQLITMLSMLFEPLTKALISKFGGLSTTAYYEMASRMVLQFRALVIAVNQVCVPRIAAQKEVESDRLSGTYQSMFAWTLFVSLPMYAWLACSVSLIGILWIGQRVELFNTFAYLLIVAYSVNTQAAPAYFMNIGEGHLQWNVWSHAIQALLTAVMGWLLGSSFGALGVVVGASGALIVASLVIIISYHRRAGVPLSALFQKGTRGLTLMMAGIMGVSWGTVSLTGARYGTAPESAILCLAGSAAIVLCVFRSPMRAELMALLRRSPARRGA